PASREEAGLVKGGPVKNGSVKDGSVKGGAVKGGLGMASRDGTEFAGRETAAAGSTDSGPSWPRRTDREAAASGRDRAHAAFGDGEEVASRPDGEPAPGRAREEVASVPDEDQVASWEGRLAARQDPERAGLWDDRVRGAASGRDDEAAPWDKHDTAPAGRE